MKLSRQRSALPSFWFRRSRAFTLPEIMVTASILILVLSGVMSSHLFGIRMYQITKAKLGANEDARRSIRLILDEIRSAKVVKVGMGSPSDFTPFSLGQSNLGNSIQIYGSTNTNAFIRYFHDVSDGKLKRLTNGVTSIVAHSVSNHLVFTAEDHLGSIQTNLVNNRVIGVTLDFYQIAYPIVQIGPGGGFDRYILHCRATRRTLE